MPETLILIYDNRLLMNKIEIILLLKKNAALTEQIWIFICLVSFTIALYLLMYMLFYDSIFSL